MPNPVRKILITGASSGIGRAAALHLAARGHIVVGSSRSLDRLAGLFGDAEERGLRVFGVELDPNSDESVDSVMPPLIAQFDGIDALVNNAGFGMRGPVASLSIGELKTQFEANFFGAVRMINALLPHMIERRSGRIVNISSVLGRIGTPFNGAYVASKYALEGISESLRTELLPFGVRVSLVEPGWFATEFPNNQIEAERSQDPSSPFAPYIRRYSQRHNEFSAWEKDPIAVARVIERAIVSPRPAFRYPVGAEAHLGALGARLLPERVFFALMRRATMG